MMPMPRPSWCNLAMLTLSLACLPVLFVVYLLPLLIAALLVGAIGWIIRAVYRSLRLAYCWLWYVVLIRGPFALYAFPKWSIRHGLPLAGEYAHWDTWRPQ